MRRACFSLLLVLLGCGGSADWAPLPSDGPARFYEGADRRLMMLPLADLDVLTGYPLAELGPDGADEQIDYAMEALGIGNVVATISEARGRAGLMETSSGARAYAVAIRDVGEGGGVPTFVMMTDTSGDQAPEDLARALARASLPVIGPSLTRTADATEAAPAPTAPRGAAPGPVRTAPGDLSGDIVLSKNLIDRGTRIVRYDLATGQLAAESDGSSANAVGGRVIFLTGCGNRNLGRQMTIADEDGFTEPVGPCLESSFGSVALAKLSPRGDRVAVLDTDIPFRVNPDSDIPIYRDVTGIRAYGADGEALVTYIGVQSPAWGPDGTLYATGTGAGEAAEPYGIYRFSDDLQSVARVDDGRLNAPVYGLQVRPDGREAAFIYNGQLWTMDMATGKPRRRLAFDFGLGALAYAPDGRRIAFLTDDPLEEATRRPGGGYHLHVFDGEQTRTITLSFIPAGPMSWVEG